MQNKHVKNCNEAQLFEFRFARVHSYATLLCTCDIILRPYAEIKSAGLHCTTSHNQAMRSGLAESLKTLCLSECGHSQVVQ